MDAFEIHVGLVMRFSYPTKIFLSLPM